MADEDITKQAVIDLARTQADDGAHYLWGAAGNRPGLSDGAQYRPNHVRLHLNVPDLEGPAKAGMFRGVPYVPTLFAGWAPTSDKGNQLCAGRCALEDVQALDLALTIADKDALELKLKTLTQAQIGEFAVRRTQPDLNRWPRPNEKLEANGYHSTLWGESCIAVRHFDCIGLVNFCFSEVIKDKKKWDSYGIKSFTEPIHAKAAGFVEVKLSAAETCDIVTWGSEHIGIVTNLNTAIEAMDSPHGVLERPLSQGPWTKCWRVPASIWKRDPGETRLFLSGRHESKV